MAPPNPNSMTWTTRWHIDKNEIPKLKRLLDIELSKPELDQGKIKRLYRSIWGWGNVTKMDDDIVARAKANPRPFTGKNGMGKAGAGLSDDQISFVGANGGYSYTTTSSSSNTSSISFGIDESDTLGMSAEMSTSIFGVDVSGSTSSETSMTLTMGQSTEETRTTETSIVSFITSMCQYSCTLFGVVAPHKKLIVLFVLYFLSQQQQTTTNNNKQQQTTTNNNKQQQTTTFRVFIWKMKIWVIILMSKFSKIPFLAHPSLKSFPVNQCALLRRVLLRVKKCKSRQRLPQLRVFLMVNLQCLRLR